LDENICLKNLQNGGILHDIGGKINIVFAEKIIFPIFFFGGGEYVDPVSHSPEPMRMSTNERTNKLTNMTDRNTSWQS